MLVNVASSPRFLELILNREDHSPPAQSIADSAYCRRIFGFHGRRTQKVNKQIENKKLGVILHLKTISGK